MSRVSQSTPVQVITCRLFGANPDSKVHGANMGPIWGRQDPGGPHIDPMNFAIWEAFTCTNPDSIRPLATNVSEIQIKIKQFSFAKTHW